MKGKNGRFKVGLRADVMRDVAESLRPGEKDELEALLVLLATRALSDSAVVVGPSEGEDLVLVIEAHRLTRPAPSHPFARLDVALVACRPGTHDPLYTRRVELETRSRPEEGPDLPQREDAPSATTLGRAARDCVVSLTSALDERLPELVQAAR